MKKLLTLSLVLMLLLTLAACGGTESNTPVPPAVTDGDTPEYQV